jgi:DNA polymerase III alpha subunit
MGAKRPKFVHLHCHSDYSFQDAVVGLPQYFKYVEESGIKCAVTDHGNLFAAG